MIFKISPYIGLWSAQADGLQIFLGEFPLHYLIHLIINKVGASQGEEPSESAPLSLKQKSKRVIPTAVGYYFLFTGGNWRWAVTWLAHGQRAGEWPWGTWSPGSWLQNHTCPSLCGAACTPAGQWDNGYWSLLYFSSPAFNALFPEVSAMPGVSRVRSHAHPCPQAYPAIPLPACAPLPAHAPLPSPQ